MCQWLDLRIVWNRNWEKLGFAHVSLGVHSPRKKRCVNDWTCGSSGTGTERNWVLPTSDWARTHLGRSRWWSWWPRTAPGTTGCWPPCPGLAATAPLPPPPSAAGRRAPCGLKKKSNIACNNNEVFNGQGEGWEVRVRGRSGWKVRVRGGRPGWGVGGQGEGWKVRVKGGRSGWKVRVSSGRPGWRVEGQGEGWEVRVKGGRSGWRVEGQGEGWKVRVRCGRSGQRVVKGRTNV